MLCRASVNILKAPCIVFISQWEGVKIFARVSGCVTLSVNITSHSFFSLPPSVRFSPCTRMRVRGFSCWHVCRAKCGGSMSGPQTSRYTATTPFYLLHVTCVALCHVRTEGDTHRHCATLFPQLRYRCSQNIGGWHFRFGPDLGRVLPFVGGGCMWVWSAPVTSY